MAIKKSQIYSTLWSSCNALRGSMDASQYKDYVLIILFVKYLSDKEDDEDSLFTIPEGCRFSDFSKLKGEEGIGEAINKKLEAIKSANSMFLSKLVLPNFNDPAKLGKPKEMTDTLSKLIVAFESGDLDFSKNRSADDDILGDAYEYLMKNFAAESGKSKGQFYTPAEVSRTMAKLLHLDEFKSSATTIYDPTCGSGSLLLKAFAETPYGAAPYGQEKDNSTATLAILNMLLHGVDIASIEQGDTLNSPEFTEGGSLKTFDICVANPPFSAKDWIGEAGEDDVQYHRWSKDMCPPAKCGDYAFLLHLIASMKTGTGRGACILPHGVLFRGNSEATIREHIIKKGYIEGIVGLPANIFFGTGIPESIIILNKAGASDRKGIFFIDAKDGFVKDGNKNRLREQDIKRIVDTWNTRKDVPHYARFVSNEEIERNEYNLNIPRYIQAEDKEIQQDIDSHLHGGIPAHDINKMQGYWDVCGSLKDALFENSGDKYSLKVDKNEVADTIASESSFKYQLSHFEDSIEKWSEEVRPELLSLCENVKPKQLIIVWSQSLLDIMKEDKSLVDQYDTYQQLMTYWNDTMQDDCYLISRDGWKVPLVTGDKKNPTYEDMTCELLPVSIVLDEYFGGEQSEIERLSTESAQLYSELQDMIEQAKENSGEEDDDELKKIVDQVKKSASYKAKDKKRKDLDKEVKDKKSLLTTAIQKKYQKLSEDEIKHLVVDKKWISAISNMILDEMKQVTHQLSNEVITLAERYEFTLSYLSSECNRYEEEVNGYLKEMGFEI